MVKEEENKELMSMAMQLATQFKQAAGNKKWFKVIHILREVKGETEDSILAKLMALSTLNMAVSKDFNGEKKFMILIDDAARVEYLQEYLSWLNDESEKVKGQIIEFSNKN